MGKSSRSKSSNEDGSGLKKPPAVRRKTQDGDTIAGVIDSNIDISDTTSDDTKIKVVIDCNLCAEEVEEGHKSVMCQKCNQWTHQLCANLNNQEMKALEKGRHNIMWFCNACTAEVVKFLKGVPTHSTERKAHVDSVGLQEVVMKLDHVAETMNKMAEQMAKREKVFESVVERKVNQYMEEKDEKVKRECNIILHNIQESVSDDTEERKRYDASSVDDVLDYLEIAVPQEAMKPVRLGKKNADSDKPRLLKVTLDSIETKKQVLSKAKTLKNSSRSDLQKVYVSPDLTPKEREANRKLREELKVRRDKGDDVMIRNGKVIEVKSDSFRGFRRGRKEPPSYAGAAAAAAT